MTEHPGHSADTEQERSAENADDDGDKGPGDAGVEGSQ